MEQPKILLYNLANVKGNKIEKLCSRLNIIVKHVAVSEYKEAIGFLTGLPDISSKGEIFTDDPFMDEMLVMSEFSETLLNTFLKEFKIQHIEPVFLKAIVTSQNKTWDSLELNKELNRERQAFGK
ncbi:DUF3783 domain-containing protein [Anaerocolumna sedimenticola]|uniref:DUF3783 domain-containing protein n=1 Tax=Anaerocolumna sedimenticola TaxID=2696063 RepID=A0A6P1TUZ6_9FIRM|nr:DUF3783 domain-containing protein [Anaerocolumna sedimenticola]QHQ63526.1 DUF3783 domain-containing protein [Anaerocolumna sedimenticola]